MAVTLEVKIGHSDKSDKSLNKDKRLKEQGSSLLLTHGR